MKNAAFSLLFVVACSGSSASNVPLPDGNATTTTPTDPANGGEAAADDGATSSSDSDASSTTAPPGTPPGANAPDCKAWAAAYCSKADACGHLVAKILGAACEQRMTGDCEAHASAPGTGYSQKALAACTSAYPSLACSDAFGETAPAACTFVGTLPLDAPCAFGDQCATGACSASATTCGKCIAATTGTPAKAKAKLGEACDEAGKSAPDCDSQFGLWCDAFTKTCAEIPMAGLGGACGYLGGMVVMCASGGTCKPGTTGSGTCVAEKAAGEACSSAASYAECAFGTTCIGGKCAHRSAAALCK